MGANLEAVSVWFVACGSPCGVCVFVSVFAGYIRVVMSSPTGSFLLHSVGRLFPLQSSLTGPRHSCFLSLAGEYQTLFRVHLKLILNPSST
ncbi:hypothetical protein B0I72DRAFT_12030 [Yarrowia lipolytica]|uniref:Uncharacterized protein n=1 Tax=Yarrowia lipolytica TaxID=4952 RepID=A0A371C069_YARLL|nr:hypothetical protein BKA91DRAFT_11882 [Yarrowia lipolytica]KAE8172197.1 hypothetical protein BKA90DRAFT_19562 [Yarrowia lipolytica]RDW23729.1 hypothetical protein B0I71DRAFT_9972 [Yarrowia lipolytica]RDW30246.1 hypothetical protein B0I72DRAFT_12030 [Yarrowia lipolytica]RDW37464.1 hypothetical protein B0I73DRAFT_6620 [Yarrowia lipolytica]